MVKLVQNSIRSTELSIAYSPCYSIVLMCYNGERMSSGGLDTPTFRTAQRLKRELNLNINIKPAITYTHCCVYVAV